MKIEDNEDLSTFLEEGIKSIYEGEATQVAMLATLKSGEVLAGYFHCNVPTKLLYAGYVHQDAILDTMKQNGYGPLAEEGNT